MNGGHGGHGRRLRHPGAARRAATAARWTAGAVAAVVAVLLTPGAGPAYAAAGAAHAVRPAHAAQSAHAVKPAVATAGYRYWSFWERTGGHWSYATQGPATARPADGDVGGFRFAVSEDSRNAEQPRGTPDFGTICRRTQAKDGVKRVALVLDFGTAADAPRGETPPARRTACARVPGDATYAEALAAVAKPLRYDANALLCAIAGYPRTGCAEQVSGRARSTTPSASSAPSASSDSSAPPAHRQGVGGPSAGLVVGAAAVLILGAATFWRFRRRG